MLRDIRKAAGKYASQPGYLPALQNNVGMMITHRKLHDFQYHLEQEYDVVKSAHAKEMLEAEHKNAQADDTARQCAEEITNVASCASGSLA